MEGTKGTQDLQEFGREFKRRKGSTSGEDGNRYIGRRLGRNGSEPKSVSESRRNSPSGIAAHYAVSTI